MKTHIFNNIRCLSTIESPQLIRLTINKGVCNVWVICLLTVIITVRMFGLFIRDVYFEISLTQINRFM